MARYPGAVWRPLANNWDSQPRLTRYDLVLLHTMVGSLASTDRYFRSDGYGGAESHFGVGHDGTVYQWQNTAHRAEANGAANARAISIETADMGPGFPRWDINNGNAVPAWTDDQLEAIAYIVAWACRTHDIPVGLIPDSRPERRGIGYHRLGVPGYVVPGGELWSSARGKSCPGPRRIAQVPGIVTRARQIIGAPPPPFPTSEGENVLENHRLDGQGVVRLNFPVGSASLVMERGWVSVSVNGPSAGSARVWFQDDDSGIAEVNWPTIWFGNGRSARPHADIPSGTTMLNIHYNFPDGGCVTLEGLSK